MSISDVERETGLSKDALRVWERRYGFPKPARSTNSERAYPADQVEQLRVIRRLLDNGLRPGQIVGLSLAELSERSARVAVTPAAPATGPGDSLQLALDLIRSREAGALREHLQQRLLQLGLRPFILEVVVPLNALVGNAWARGALEIFEEHHYTDQVQRVLQHALGSLPQPGQPPYVLLTTLPGEEHQLGMLMAHAFLAMEGARCLSLGAQTPVVEIVKAARAHRVDIVGLSSIPAHQPRRASTQLIDLRTRLDRRVELWVGGARSPGRRNSTLGVTSIASLAQIPAAVLEWRARRGEVERGWTTR